MRTTALDAFSAQGKQPFLVLDTDSFTSFQMVEVMESVTVMGIYSSHISGDQTFCL